MTKQETFDTVVRALIVQGKRSKSTTDRCLYRGPGNTKCAAGHLIPDEIWRAEWEGCGVVRHGEIGMNEISVLLDGLGHDLRLCRDLQIAHDVALDDRFVASFTQDARATGAEHKLDTSICDWRPE